MKKKAKSRRAPYKRMLTSLKSTKTLLNPAGIPNDPWFLYIVECHDGSLYTGITKDLEKRIKAHNDGKGARFTRSRRPVKMIYHESLSGRAQALVREYEVKTLPRAKKQALREMV